MNYLQNDRRVAHYYPPNSGQAQLPVPYQQYNNQQSRILGNRSEYSPQFGPDNFTLGNRANRQQNVRI